MLWNFRRLFEVMNFKQIMCNYFIPDCMTLKHPLKHFMSFRFNELFHLEILQSTDAHLWCFLWNLFLSKQPRTDRMYAVRNACWHAPWHHLLKGIVFFTLYSETSFKKNIKTWSVKWWGEYTVAMPMKDANVSWDQEIGLTFPTNPWIPQTLCFLNLQALMNRCWTCCLILHFAEGYYYAAKLQLYFLL